MTNIFNNVTIEQFKAYFFRDFPYLPIWNEDKTYWKGDIVFSVDNFYQSTEDDNTGNDPQTYNQTIWQKIKGDIYNYITDDDIQKAMTQAINNGNEFFGETLEEKVNIYLHLVAFYLVMDLKNAQIGINGGVAGAVTSTHVGDVSESYAIPQWMLNDPMYSMFAQNAYGLKYLSLIAPYLAITILYSRGSSTFG